jgi:lysozyme family protein
MANYLKAFERLMGDEGIVLTDTPHDRGGQTFAGVTRKNHPDWQGWKYIDAGSLPPIDMVRNFYNEYWHRVRGDEIISQRVAEVLFGQHVNMGANAIKLMQTSLGVIADGVVGPKTLNALNAMDEEMFLMRYSLANIARYHAIGMKDKTQRKFWAGWFKRGLDVCK